MSFLRKALSAPRRVLRALVAWPFRPSDFFLRHASKKRHIRNGAVDQSIFDDKHPTLSFTQQDAELKTPRGLDAYQLYMRIRDHGDAVGLCKLSFEDLAWILKPQRRPRRDDNSEKDRKYGHLHCVTDRPRDLPHREKMAALATRNGDLREFVPANKIETVFDFCLIRNADTAARHLLTRDLSGPH